MGCKTNLLCRRFLVYKAEMHIRVGLNLRALMARGKALKRKVTFDVDGEIFES
jgi:hypothetical protein